MSRFATEVSQQKGVDERRNAIRKRVLLSGVVVHPSGNKVVDCAIRDLNVHGAQLRLPEKLPLGEEIYLLDIRNQAAYLASVVWSLEDRAGVNFVRGYALDAPLPPNLKFLGKSFLEAKLRQVRSLLKRGVSVEEATSIVGLTEDHFKSLGEQV